MTGMTPGTGPEHDPPRNDGFSDEALMMFADGTLPPEEMDRVAAAIDADPAVAERAAAFFATRDALKGAFSGVMNERPPERLLRTVLETPIGLTAEKTAVVTPFPAERSRRRIAWAPTALAASLAAVVAGIAGFMAGRMQPDDQPAIAGLLATPAPLYAAAETAGDGRQTPILAGRLVAVATGTYRLADRRLCRLFEIRPAGRGDGAEALVCRETAGWRLEAAALVRAEPGYRPAGAAKGLDAILEAGGAEAALDAREVERLILDRWR